MKYKEICDSMGDAGWLSHEIAACNTDYGNGPRLNYALRRTHTFQEFELGQIAPSFSDGSAVRAKLNYKDEHGGHNDPILIDSATGFILRVVSGKRLIGFLSDIPKSHLTCSSTSMRSLPPAFRQDGMKEQGKYGEGACKQITTNRYERNAKARQKCVEHYGFHCQVCDFDFKRFYGKAGLEFIHVHHIIPQSKIRGSYIIDPIADLRPVCPNCHAMIHRDSELLTIESLRALVPRKSQ